MLLDILWLRSRWGPPRTSVAQRSATLWFATRSRASGRVPSGTASLSPLGCLSSAAPSASFDKAEVPVRGHDHMVPCHHPDELRRRAKALGQIGVLRAGARVVTAWMV